MSHDPADQTLVSKGCRVEWTRCLPYLGDIGSRDRPVGRQGHRGDVQFIYAMVTEVLYNLASCSIPQKFDHVRKKAITHA